MHPTQTTPQRQPTPRLPLNLMHRLRALLAQISILLGGLPK
ncbi:MAG: hypothetical protein WBP54_04065 [Pelodictyon phaeoclathratiforme]